MMAEDADFIRPVVRTVILRNFWKRRWPRLSPARRKESEPRGVLRLNPSKWLLPAQLNRPGRIA